MIKVQIQLTLILEEFFTYYAYSATTSVLFCFFLTLNPRGVITYNQLSNSD
jgi:hypothetical protein